MQFNVVASADEARRGKINLVKCGEIDPALGTPSPEAGKAAVEALEAAARDLKSGSLDAVVTAPINKETAQSDDFRFTGHTEYFADRFGGEPMMIMCSDRLRVGLVTIHIPMAEVSASITQEKIVRSLATLRESLIKDFGIVEPRIAVLALNPHAGEGGMLGHEEQNIIKPAIEQAFGDGILALRRRRLRQVRRRAGHVPRSGAHPVQDHLARRGELHRGTPRGAHLARPRHRIRHSRHGKSGRKFDAVDIFKRRMEHIRLTKNPLRTQAPKGNIHHQGEEDPDMAQMED